MFENDLMVIKDKKLSFTDTDWNIYKWNDIIFGLSFEITGMGGAHGGYTDETRFPICWLSWS